MPIDVTMPKLSDTMEEGKILHWLKQPGDRVAIGDVLAEVETDKANMELEAYDEGVLAEIRVGEEESVPVGAVIAVLAAPGEEKPATGGAKKKAAAAAAPPASERVAETGASEPPAARGPAKRPGGPRPVREPVRPAVVSRPAPAGERVRVSPLARRIAAEEGVDLATVRGSGPDGRIVERDVRAASGGEARVSRPAPRAPAPPRTAPGRVELSKIRRTTAKRMADAKREVPHFYASAEIAMDEAVRLKGSLAALEGEWTGVTYTHLILKATGLALARAPELNASWDGDAVIVHDEVNVGMAVSVDDGLMVPVVHHCDREPLAAIVRRARELVERARGGRFSGDDLSGATFTVSNLGMLPVSDFAAVVNQPQAAILAVGAIREVPVVRAGAVVPGRVMTVTLSSDHRLVDGMLAGRFLRELKALLENPVALLV
jgi:pyruvate dehydrogenase E2 component (dihydrolipoyllysine-residue acetyltransferase)